MDYNVLHDYNADIRDVRNIAGPIEQVSAVAH